MAMPKPVVDGSMEGGIDLGAGGWIVEMAQGGQPGETDARRSMAPGRGEHRAAAGFTFAEVGPIAVFPRKQASLVGDGLERRGSKPALAGQHSQIEKRPRHP